MEAQAGVLKGYKIFVAEDDKDVQAFMRRCLEYYGAEVTTVSNGLDAVETLLHESFDVALMDIEMPACNGLEAVDRIRAGGYRQPIVALSTLCNRPEWRQYIEKSFDEGLEKPVLLPTLIETIKHYKAVGETAIH